MATHCDDVDAAASTDVWRGVVYALTDGFYGERAGGYVIRSGSSGYSASASTVCRPRRWHGPLCSSSILTVVFGLPTSALAAQPDPEWACWGSVGGGGRR